jgi:surface antigen
MKSISKIGSKMGVIVLLSAYLMGCANMSQQDVGTLSGGIAGGLIGSTVGRGSGQFLAIAAGTLAGAYIGGAIGRNMDENDRANMDRALERNDVGEPAYWNNPRTHAHYEVVPIRNITREGNRYCREYRTVGYIGGKKQEIYGTACRHRDGSWEAMN